MYRPSSAPPISTDIVIIGAGVAGLSASKILLDEKIDFWILGSPYESQLAKAGELKKTSLPNGTIGLQFIEEEMEKLKNRNINHRSSLCTGIEIQDDGFLVKTKYQNFIAKVVLITSGCKQGKLGFEGEEEFFQQGISDCSVCDYPLYRNKSIAVIGNHEYTKRAAEFLKRHTKKISLLWYQDSDIPAVDGVKTYPGVTNVKVTGSDVIERISFESKVGNEELEIQGLFVEGKPVPNTNFIKNSQIELSPKGFIKVNNHFETTIKGIWAAGDVTGRSHSYDDAKQNGEEVVKHIISYIS